MAAKGRKGKGREERIGAEPVSANEKIACLLGVLATKGIDQISERVTLLRAVGFSVPEVAAILGMTENHVRVATHHGRKKQRETKAGRAKKH